MRPTLPLAATGSESKSRGGQLPIRSSCVCFHPRFRRLAGSCSLPCRPAEIGLKHEWLADHRLPLLALSRGQNRIDLIAQSGLKGIELLDRLGSVSRRELVDLGQSIIERLPQAIELRLLLRRQLESLDHGWIGEHIEAAGLEIQLVKPLPLLGW